MVINKKVIGQQLPTSVSTVATDLKKSYTYWPREQPPDHIPHSRCKTTVIRPKQTLSLFIMTR